MPVTPGGFLIATQDAQIGQGGGGGSPAGGGSSSGSKVTNSAAPPMVVNDLRSSDLAVTEIQNPQQIKLFREAIAHQMNTQRMAQPPAKAVLDLSDFIADVVVETSVQGAGTLEIHVIDPFWVMLTTDKNGASFFQVDQDGYLWPPIDLNFPPGVSDAQWRLCALKPSTDITAANLILIFEDKCASVMRELTGPVQSNPNETRAEFIKRLVNEARVGAPMPPVNYGAFSITPQIPPKGQLDGKIRFVPLLPSSTFTSADLTTPPASATNGKRSNPGKNAGPPIGLNPYLAPIGPALSIADAINAMTSSNFYNPSQPNPVELEPGRSGR